MSTFQLNVTVAPLNEVVTLGEKQVRVQSDEIQVPVPVTLIELPANLIPPTIQLVGGDAPQPGGSVQVAQPGSWDGSPVLTYQWRANAIAISGETNPLSLSLLSAYVGKEIDILEIPNGDVAKAAESSNGIVVLPNPPANTTLPVVSPAPTAALGTTVSATPGEFTNDPDSFLIQWQRNEADIPGATGTTHDTTGMSVGDVLRTKVTATNAGGTSPEVFSNTTTLVEV